MGFCTAIEAPQLRSFSPKCRFVVLSKTHHDEYLDSTVVLLPRVTQEDEAVGLEGLIEVGRWCCQIWGFYVRLR